jgi:hypothetical protein
MIDTTFDFRSDTPPGKDPDSFSPTLRRYHQLLWSKPLPSGAPFDLDILTHPFLHHHSDIGQFWLSSDAVIPTFARSRQMADVVAHVPQEETDEFVRLSYTIGGMMVFPGNRVDGKMTINGHRGCHSQIKDRFDLTVECVRRHYAGLPSPLTETLRRYAAFFALFEDFAGYVDFFLLQDIVDDRASAVRFFAPFDDFTTSPLPRPVTAYLAYRARAMEFLGARNERIATRRA